MVNLRLPPPRFSTRSLYVPAQEPNNLATPLPEREQEEMDAGDGHHDRECDTHGMANTQFGPDPEAERTSHTDPRVDQETRPSDRDMDGMAIDESEIKERTRTDNMAHAYPKSESTHTDSDTESYHVPDNDPELDDFLTTMVMKLTVPVPRNTFNSTSEFFEIEKTLSKNTIVEESPEEGIELVSPAELDEDVSIC